MFGNNPVNHNLARVGKKQAEQKANNEAESVKAEKKKVDDLVNNVVAICTSLEDDFSKFVGATELIGKVHQFWQKAEHFFRAWLSALLDLKEMHVPMVTNASAAHKLPQSRL